MVGCGGRLTYEGFIACLRIFDGRACPPRLLLGCVNTNAYESETYQVNNFRILIIDDDESLCQVMEYSLNEAGLKVDIAYTGEEGISLFNKGDYRLVICDLKLPGMNGMEVLTKIKSISPEAIIIIITAFGSVEQAVEAMKRGAYDYTTKPVALEELKLIVDKALERISLLEENKRLKTELQMGGKKLVTRSEKMLALLEMVKKIAKTSASVLISGESGTGKELLARIIHYNSDRRQAPFIALNCAAIPRELLESELFGHVKGAFTGAVRDKKGKFELANRGTFFLDEVGEFPLELQAKLLRVLQEDEIDPVGAEKPVPINVRVIAASNRNLEELIAQQRFREDLYYRINVIPIIIPPLRERTEDIPLLLQYFINKYSPDREIKLSSGLLAELQNYPWRGNVRELENICKRMVILRESDELTVDDLPWRTPPQKPTIGQLSLTLPDESLSLEELEKEIIRKSLEKHSGNQTKTARYLQIARHVLIYRMDKYGLKG